MSAVRHRIKIMRKKRHRREMSNILSYIHGDEGAVPGAWDFIASLLLKKPWINLLETKKEVNICREFLEMGLRISTTLKSL